MPTLVNRKVDKANNAIEIAMRYEDYDFDCRVVVTGKGNAVEISVYLDGFSQVGYVPEQPKVAVIELDKKDTMKPTASIFRIREDGTTSEVFKGNIQPWGPYFKYNYVKFDFSSVREPSIYYIQYGNIKTNYFLIDNSVYDKITDATTDVWIPIHMNHMTVNEGYRVWHGEPFKEGYLQAPPSDHFELWQVGC